MSDDTTNNADVPTVPVTEEPAVTTPNETPESVPEVVIPETEVEIEKSL